MLVKMAGAGKFETLGITRRVRFEILGNEPVPALLYYLRKVVGGFGKKSCVSTGVRKPGNICVTDHHDITFAVKVELNSNTTNQSIKPLKL